MDLGIIGHRVKLDPGAEMRPMDRGLPRGVPKKLVPENLEPD